ncbi:hypothetical protein CU097_006419, partial [Rhizopus azygosporus]
NTTFVYGLSVCLKFCLDWQVCEFSDYPLEALKSNNLSTPSGGGSGLRVCFTPLSSKMWEVVWEVIARDLLKQGHPPEHGTHRWRI